jgi:hypothetical protein
MEDEGSSETLVVPCQTEGRHIPRIAIVNAYGVTFGSGLVVEYTDILMSLIIDYSPFKSPWLKCWSVT